MGSGENARKIHEKFLKFGLIFGSGCDIIISEIW